MEKLVELKSIPVRQPINLVGVMVHSSLDEDGMARAGIRAWMTEYGRIYVERGDKAGFITDAGTFECDPIGTGGINNTPHHAAINPAPKKRGRPRKTAQ